jgi:hypothetical protein
MNTETETGTAKAAITFLDEYAKSRLDRPFKLKPSDFSDDINCSPQLIGTAQSKIISELTKRGHDVSYEKVNNKRHFCFQ